MRVFMTVCLVVLYLCSWIVYQVFQPALEASLSVGQLSDSIAAPSLARAVASGSVLWWWTLLCATLLLVLWTPRLFHHFRSRPLPLAALALACTAIQACGPYQAEIVEVIQPNETAFLVPLEGKVGDQGKFMSEEFLKGAKVAVKQMSIPTRQQNTGRMWGDYKWIPTARLIKVDRTPQTRTWVGDRGIAAESKESVDFRTGITCTASVKEEEAHTFLYNYAGKPLSLVMDSDVHGFIGAAVWSRFAGRSLLEINNTKAQVVDEVTKDARVYFQKLGVNIMQCGGAEGLTYTDPKIQDAINKTFIAENDRKTAAAEKEAQVDRNARDVAKAVAERQVAEEFLKAREGNVLKRQLEIDMRRADAMMEAAKNLPQMHGQLPSVLPPGSTLLFGFDTAKAK